VGREPVTDEARAMPSADDAELLNRVCAGDTSAFQILYQRHEQAARWLARDLVATADEVDDVVAETFGQLLEVTRRGSGPADAFRPYMLTALRRVCDLRREKSPETTADNAAEPYLDLAVASLDDPLIVRAYLSLPERWMAVLWHTEIEGASQAEVGQVLGLSRDGVATLRRRAKEGLTQAYLQMYTSGLAVTECAAIALRLGPFIRDAVSGPDSADVTQHLSQCDRCRAVFAELSDVSLPLRATVAPAFLGGSAAYYLSRTAPAAKERTAPAPVDGPTAPATAAMGEAAMAEAAAAAAAAAGAAWWRRPAGFPGGTARSRRWLAASAAAAVVLGAIAVAVAASGHSTPLKPAGTDQAKAPDSLQVPTTAGKPSPTPGRSTTAPGLVRATVSRSARATQPANSAGATSPAGQPPKSPAPNSPSPSSSAELTAAVDVYGGHHGASVVFKVSDTGSAKTKALVVSVALPAGSSLSTWPNGPGNGGGGGGNGGGGNGGGGHHGDSDHWGQSGWSCKATSSGARCRHAAIAAGGQSQGVIFISINGSSACGQTVSVTVASGSASATAQSPEEIQC
jgi:RNA polymerase sigma factor (sigma-70 family)